MVSGTDEGSSRLKSYFCAVELDQYTGGSELQAVSFVTRLTSYRELHRDEFTFYCSRTQEHTKFSKNLLLYSSYSFTHFSLSLSVSFTARLRNSHFLPSHAFHNSYTLSSLRGGCRQLKNK